MILLLWRIIENDFRDMLKDHQIVRNMLGITTTIGEAVSEAVSEADEVKGVVKLRPDRKGYEVT